MGRRKLLVPEAEPALNRLKVAVMQREGLNVKPESPDNVKFEVAKQLGVPLNKGYNGHIEAQQAGKIGGAIGGKMVSELIKIAKEKMNEPR